MGVSKFIMFSYLLFIVVQLVASTSFHFLPSFIYHRMQPAMVLAVVSLATHFGYFARAQDVGMTTLSNWTQCSSICWCGKDNSGHVHAHCSVRKLEKGVEFNLSRDLYALWVSKVHNLIHEFLAFFTSGRRFHVATETTSDSSDLDRWLHRLLWRCHFKILHEWPTFPCCHGNFEWQQGPWPIQTATVMKTSLQNSSSHYL